MPEWLIQILVQFPIVVIIGLVAWYAYGQVKATKDEQLKASADSLKAAELRHEKEQAAAETRRAEDLKRLQEALDKQQELLKQTIQAKNEEIGRLKDEILTELRAVGRKVDKLTQKRTG